MVIFGLILAGPSPTAAEPGKSAPAEISLLTEVGKEFQAHNYKKVIRLYRQFVEDHPDRYVPATVRVLYSQALADTGDLDDAIEALQSILNDLPDQMDPLKLRYDLGNLLFLERRFDEARTVYHKMILEAAQAQERVAKAKERIALMKDRDANAKKKDLVSIQLLDIETSLESGDVPDGAVSALQQIIEQNPSSSYAAYAERLRNRIGEIRVAKAKALLDEARKLYDTEKNYAEVREILEVIRTRYSDVSEMPSIEALSKDVNAKLGRR